MSTTMRAGPAGDRTGERMADVVGVVEVELAAEPHHDGRPVALLDPRTGGSRSGSIESPPSETIEADARLLRKQVRQTPLAARGAPV